jgi:hypothetical protein
LRPVATGTTASSGIAACNRSSDGISRRQGAHQVAQKFSTTHLPL